MDHRALSAQLLLTKSREWRDLDVCRNRCPPHLVRQLRIGLPVTCGPLGMPIIGLPIPGTRAYTLTRS